MNPSPDKKQGSQGGDVLDRALRASIGGRLVSAGAAAVSSAWTTSVSRSYLSASRDGWRALAPVTRVRTLALAGIIAVVVHRAMSRLGPPEPLGAVVPALVLVACGLTALCAGPIARVSERLGR
jgi:hypothetical protein